VVNNKVTSWWWLVKKILVLSTILMFLVILTPFSISKPIKPTTTVFTSTTTTTVPSSIPSHDIRHIKEKTDVIEKRTEIIEKLLKGFSKRNIEFHGTDYFPHENGKIFLQLLDENRSDVNNGWCWLDIYYPNSSIMIDDGSMVRLGENGLYYYDILVPDDLGVYMLSAYCKYPTVQTVVNNYENKSDDGTPDFNFTITDSEIIYSNRYTIPCNASEIIGGKFCYYGQWLDRRADVIFMIDLSPIGVLPYEPDEGWHCIDIPLNFLQSHAQVPTYWGLECRGCRYGYLFTLFSDNYQSDSYYWRERWIRDRYTYYIRINYTCVENITFNESMYVDLKGSGEMHVHNISFSCDLTELNDSIWESSNHTINEINNSIYNAKNQILDNITSEINESESNIINEIKTIEDNIITILNSTMYSIRDYLYNTIISARNYIVSVLNQTVWDSNEDIKSNITSEINDSESNIINEVNTTGDNIIEEVRNSCNITENITANITAECNPRELLKYFIAIYGD